MVKKPTVKQQEIIDCTASRIIVNACPGSGKTFSVTARLAKLLKQNKLNRHQGIAVLSFTNVACDEIKKGLKENFGIREITYPNFIGTIDSFINNYIFLPYGHLEMQCQCRPEIVGTEHNKWFDYDSTLTRIFNKRISMRDPNYYFDKVSFIDKETCIPHPLMPPTSYHFSWKEDKIIKIDGSYCKKITDIIEIKWNHFKIGKANQADANYFANRILLNYPQIANNLVNRFPTLIIDEAQDTAEVQMSIIDTLDEAGINNIMLIGDPDQAIFEWNTADPELFIDKWNNENWVSLSLDENMRSSKKICEYLNRFFNSDMTSISVDKNHKEPPKVLGHLSDMKSVHKISNDFLDECEKSSFNSEKIAIVYRGRNFGEQYFGIQNDSKTYEEMPWENGFYFVRDLVQGKYLIENGYYKDGLRLIEKGYYKFLTGERYVSHTFLQNKKNDIGYRNYRSDIFSFINKLPDVEEKKLIDWVNEANENGDFKFRTKTPQSRIEIRSLFDNSIKEDVSFFKTIHSIKGESLDAILVFLVKRDNSNYSTLLPKEYNCLSNKDKEQMRIVYVACSRPRKILWLAIPMDDVADWSTFFEN